jgi:hypothetical protein
MLIIGCGVVGVTLVLVCGRRLYERLTRRHDTEMVNALIAQKGARKVYESVDWRLVNRAGERRWNEALRGQRRLQKDEHSVRRFPSRIA